MFDMAFIPACSLTAKMQWNMSESLETPVPRSKMLQDESSWIMLCKSNYRISPQLSGFKLVCDDLYSLKLHLLYLLAVFGMLVTDTKWNPLCLKCCVWVITSAASLMISFTLLLLWPSLMLHIHNELVWPLCWEDRFNTVTLQQGCNVHFC